MNNVLGVINLTNRHKVIDTLTNHRCQASVPFGGRYRMIDFLLSSMVNSTIPNVGVFTSKEHRSLIDHLGVGKDWDLYRKQDGLFVFPYDMPSGLREVSDLAFFHKHIDFFEKSPQQHILLAYGSPIVNIDFKPIFRKHMKSKAAVTLIYKNSDEVMKKQWSDYQHILLDDDDIVTQLAAPHQSFESNHVSLDMLFIKKSLFIDIIKTYYMENVSFMDVLSKETQNFITKGYRYDGYYAKVESIQDYYSYNMKLLNPEILHELFVEPNETYTKLKDEPPTKYLDTAKVRNSLIANGCIIEGEVENSILFRGVHVKKGASIKNSIVMQKCSIGEFSKLNQSILDKEVIVIPNHEIKGSYKEPYVVAKKATI